MCYILSCPGVDMKKRFRNDDDYDDEDEFQDDLFPNIDDEDEFEDDELNEDYLRILEKRELTEVAKLELIQKQLNYDILNKALIYVNKSFFWFFKSKKAKLTLIMETYQTFKALIDLDTVKQEIEEI